MNLKSKFYRDTKVSITKTNYTKNKLGRAYDIVRKLYYRFLRKMSEHFILYESDNCDNFQRTTLWEDIQNRDE